MMMSARIQAQETNRVLNLTAYITIFGVSAAGILETGSFWPRWGAVAALVAFTLLFARQPKADHPARQRLVNVSLGLETLLVCFLLLLQPGSNIFVILFFILSSVAMLGNPFKAGLAWIGLFTFISAVNFIYAFGWADGLQYLAIYAGGYLFFGVVSASLAQARSAREQAEVLLAQLSATNDQLGQANRQLKEYADRVEAIAIMDERTRMAREMHDTIGHRLTVAAVQLEGAQRLISHNPDRAAQMVGTVREQVREALAELRGTVARLREPIEADMLLSEALQRLVASFSEATGLDIGLQVEDDLPPIPPLYRQALFRAAQEGLTNVQRHARATRAWVDVRQEGPGICLTVSDDGQGYPTDGGTTADGTNAGFGLLGIKERASQLGGTLEQSDRPGGGARLRVCLPLPQEPSHA